MRLNAEKTTQITEQTVPFLTTSNGADPLTLKVGTSSGPATLELVEAWDSASNDVLEQVIETLFFYNKSESVIKIYPYYSAIIPISKGMVKTSVR